jgi:hypothetical protein
MYLEERDVLTGAGWHDHPVFDSAPGQRVLMEVVGTASL